MIRKAACAIVLCSVCVFAQDLSRFPPPRKNVTLAATNMPLREVFDHLASQSGLSVTVPDQDGNGLVTVAIRDQPFWDSILSLLSTNRAAPVAFSVREADGNSTNQLVRGRMSAHGPFLVIANSLSRAVDYTQPDADADSLTITGMIISDPSVRVLRMTPAITPARALDDQGRSWVPPQPLPLRFNLFTGTSPLTPARFTLQLRPPRDANGRFRSLKLVEGTIPVTYIAPDLFQLSPGDTFDRRVGDTNFVMEFPKPDPAAPPPAAGAPQLTIRMIPDTPGPRPPATGPAGDQPISIYGLPVNFAVQYRDADGKFVNAAIASRQTNADAQVFSYQFIPAGPAGRARRGGPPVVPARPASVRIAIPSVPVEFNVPYRFENMDLP